VTPILAVRDLQLDYLTGEGTVRALDGADLDVPEGVSLGIVGESGSGKSTLGLAVGRLLPGNLRRSGGELTLRGRSVFACGPEEMRRLRRDLMGFVFQNPMQALDPTMRVGAQLALANGDLRPPRDALIDELTRVGLREPERVLRSYPHELSGGMAQRVVIAMAIARKPQILVADEPTASLDATIRDQVLKVLVAQSRAVGATMLLLSHELHVVARMCEVVAVMYGGRVVEVGEAASVFRRPVHPYTRALLRAAPGHEPRHMLLKPIPGMPPVLRGPSQGCAFAPRCDMAGAICTTTRPSVRVVDGRRVLCHFAEDSLAVSERAEEAVA
jgi:peptide/nickel transport system ATP-binding protein